VTLELEHVSRFYGGTGAVLDVTLSVQSGEVLGYLGPNGSGKSTTVKMLAGLLAPSSGTIRFDGTDIQDILLEYKAIVGYVPEEAHLYSYLTAEEYLRLAGRLHGIPGANLERRITTMLTVLGLHRERQSALSTFSKGMRQKVLLAAALIHDPEVVILDEPASGFDVGAMLVLRAIVRGLTRRARVVFYSSHEMDTVERISTRVVIIRSGRIVADGSASELRDLTRRASLEDVFAQLTVAEDVEEVAGHLIEAIQL
jgi:ABC-2 type transport system ATP-binding protein